MKALALCTVFSALAIALSQPTYDLEQQELCDGVCQQDDLKTLQSQFKTQFTAMKNEIFELKQEVNKVLQIYTEYSGNTVNATTLPGDYPTSPSCPVSLNFTYVPLVNGCYHVVLDKMQWTPANKHCISLHPNSHLVIINSRAKHTVLSDMLRKQIDIGNSWTAGQRVNVTNDPSSFIWILQTSNYYAKLPINYDGWILREPNNNGGHEYCLVQVQYVNYFWQDRSCADRNVFFCEIDIA